MFNSQLRVTWGLMQYRNPNTQYMSFLHIQVKYSLIYGYWIALLHAKLKYSQTY